MTIPEVNARRQRWCARVCCAAGTLAFGAPLMAQESGLEEITVTARFREENLQETPLAITAFTGENLEARNLTDVTMIDTFSPNTVIQPLGAGWGSTAAAFIRGVGLGDNSLSYEPGVPIYIDDVYHGRPQGAILDLLDLVRGPQGTLFGRNAVGGTVRLVSRKPEGDGSGFAEVIMGDFDRLDVRGSYDIAIVPDKFFARFSGSSKQRDGYFDILDYECVNGPGSLGGGGTGTLPGATNLFGGPIPPTDPIDLHGQLGPQDIRAEGGCVVETLGDENVATGRAAFRWVPGDNVEVNFAYDVTRLDQQGPSDKYTYLDPNFFFNSAYTGTISVPIFNLPYDTRFLTNSPYTGYHRFGPDPLFNRDVENINVLDHDGVALTLDWDVTDNVHFKSITAYRDWENTFGRDSDGSPLPVDHTWDTSIHEQLTQEFQITGLAANNRLDWATGFFYYDADDSNQGWNFLYPLFFLTTNHKDVQTDENWAVFAHFTYDINDVLSINGGLRYTDDQKDVTVYRQDFVTGGVVIPNAKVSVDAQKTSPKLGLTWQIRDDLMTYVQWSTGFRGGGFGPRPSNVYQVENGSFDVEDLETLEGGVKTDLRDGKLRVNADIFFSEYTNQQQFQQQTDPTGAIWFRSVNTGKTEYTGAELEVLAAPTDQLQIEGALGYIHFDRVDNGTTTLCESDPPGGHCMAPRTPEWTAALGATYTWMMGNGSSLALRGDATYQSLMAFSPDDPFNGFQPAHTLVDARFTWRSPSQDWSIALFGTNLTDEVYFHGKLSLVGVLGREQGNVARPREWGISLRRDF